MKLERQVQLCLATGERLQPETCLAALFPKVGNMGELMLGKCVGSGGPRSLRGHGRTPLAGGRPRTFSDSQLSGVVSPQGHSAIS